MKMKEISVEVLERGDNYIKLKRFTPNEMADLIMQTVVATLNEANDHFYLQDEREKENIVIVAKALVMSSLEDIGGYTKEDVDRAVLLSDKKLEIWKRQNQKK